MLLILALIAAVVVGLLLWNNRDKPMIIKREYPGIRWTNHDKGSDDSVPFTLLIDGISAKDEPFRGTIIIKNGDETLYHFDDCKLVYENNKHYLCDADFPEPYTVDRLPALEHYAVMYFSEDWSDVVLVNVKAKPGRWDGTSDVIFAAPATRKEEAIATAKRTPAATRYGTFYE